MPDLHDSLGFSPMLAGGKLDLLKRLFGSGHSTAEAATKLERGFATKDVNKLRDLAKKHGVRQWGRSRQAFEPELVEAIERATEAKRLRVENAQLKPIIPEGSPQKPAYPSVLPVTERQQGILDALKRQEPIRFRDAGGAAREAQQTLEEALGGGPSITERARDALNIPEGSTPSHAVGHLLGTPVRAGSRAIRGSLRDLFAGMAGKPSGAAASAADNAAIRARAEVKRWAPGEPGHDTFHHGVGMNPRARQVFGDLTPEEQAEILANPNKKLFDPETGQVVD